MDDVIIVGAGGHAKVIIECLAAQSAHVIGIVDESKSGELSGIKIVGKHIDQTFSGRLIIAIGDNVKRKMLAQNSRHSFLTAIHPSALVSKKSTIGVGCMLLHNSILQTDTSIGNHVIINTAAQVDHDCTISDYCHIGPGAILCGNVTVGEGTFIGAGVTVIPSIKIGKWATIGAGSVVIKDVPDHAVVAGNPAKNIK